MDVESRLQHRRYIERKFRQTVVPIIVIAAFAGLYAAFACIAWAWGEPSFAQPDLMHFSVIVLGFAALFYGVCRVVRAILLAAL